MAMQRIAVIRLVVDVCFILAVGLTVLLLTLLGHPFQRGFYCNDETIKYPRQPHTVSTLGVGLGALFIPIALMAAIEATSARATAPSASVSFFHKTPPRGVVRWLRLSGVFLFGAGVAQVIVDVAKFMIGRLRPHFLAVCQLDAVTAGRCAAGNTLTYVTDYRCLGAEKDVEEARLSFPSGHASLAFYGAVFAIMYLECAATSWSFSRLLRHVAQFLLVIGAWFTALSRVSDYHHHWSDVLAGMAIGSLIAVLNVMFLSGLRRQYALSRGKRDETENLALMTSCDTNSNTMGATTTTYTHARPEAGEPNNLV